MLLGLWIDVGFRAEQTWVSLALDSGHTEPLHSLPEPCQSWARPYHASQRQATSPTTAANNTAAITNSSYCTNEVIPGVAFTAADGMAFGH